MITHNPSSNYLGVNTVTVNRGEAGRVSVIFRRQQVLSDHLRAWWVITNRYRKPEGEVQAELMSVSHVAIQSGAVIHVLAHDLDHTQTCMGTKRAFYC